MNYHSTIHIAVSVSVTPKMVTVLLLLCGETLHGIFASTTGLQGLREAVSAGVSCELLIVYPSENAKRDRRGIEYAVVGQGASNAVELPLLVGCKRRNRALLEGAECRI